MPLNNIQKSMNLPKLLNMLLSFFNIKLINKKFGGVVDKRELLPFQEGNENLRLYYEGLKKSENTHADNFFKQSRFLDLINLTEKLLQNQENQIFDFVECGCWTGHSSYIISKLIKKYNKDIKFHIFDSFEGLSSNIENDEQLKNLSSDELKRIRKQFSSNEDFVKHEVLKDFKFIKTYKGWIPEKFFLVENNKFSLIHIDVDLYEPTLKSLEFFYPRLVEGGIIVCDDYNSKYFSGSKKAWDEFFSNKKLKVNFSPSLGSSFIIK